MVSISFKELRGMTEEERDRALAELVRHAREMDPAAALQKLDAEIRSHEEHYGFDSDELRRRINAGEQTETFEICQWLMLVARRDRIASLTTRTR